MPLRTKKSYQTGAELVRRRILTWNQVQEALEAQERTGEFIGQILIRLGYISEQQLVEVLSDQFELPLVNPAQLAVPKIVLEQVPPRVAHHYHIFPTEITPNHKLVLAMPEPPDYDLVQELSAVLGVKIKVVLGARSHIDEAIKKQYGIGASIVERMSHAEELNDELQAVVPVNQVVPEETDASGGEASVRELVNQWLMDAQKKRASDIHIEPFSDQLRIRHRIDGVLYEADVPEGIKRFHEGIVSRIKIMARLDISERRLPQDGRIKIRIGDNALDLRVSTIPTAFGEAIVIRILSPTRLLKLDSVGLSENCLQQLRTVIAKPWGITLLTGPTGCGKTTTLYACLSELNSGGRKIITVEDPVEYQLNGIIQMQVHPKIGLTFAQGLRHMLRHDPDIMMIGEIRDSETAEIAIRSALTGHLVFSTLHTNDAPSAVIRLVDLGIEPYLVASSIECVIAQRLVRVLCNSCKKKGSGGSYVSGKCDQCHETGFCGRTAMHEFLILDEELKAAVSQRRSVWEIRNLAVKKGMTSLREDGMKKVKAGITTESELLQAADIS